MPVPTKTVTVPDLNVNMQIEAAATKAGALVGAVVTAGIGGIATGLWGLFQGAKIGATVTHANMGNAQVQTQNTSIGAKAAAAQTTTP